MSPSQLAGVCIVLLVGALIGAIANEPDDSAAPFFARGFLIAIGVLLVISIGGCIW